MCATHRTTAFELKSPFAQQQQIVEQRRQLPLRAFALQRAAPTLLLTQLVFQLVKHLLDVPTPAI